MELGYSFTSSIEECRSSITGLDGREISPACVARVISHMARTCSNLDDTGGIHSFWTSSGVTQENKDKAADGSTTWNVEVFVLTLKEIVSSTTLF